MNLIYNRQKIKMKEQILAERALYEKYRNTKSSGYLDDQYELTPEFRQVDEYYFRIEDEKQIIQIQNLQKKSVPMSTGFSIPSQASHQFNTKMDNLVNILDSLAPMRQQQRVEVETHGFYKIDDDAYDEKKSMEAAYEHLHMQNLTKRMQCLTIDPTKIKFKERSSKMVEQQPEKELTKKMKKLTIEDRQL